MDITERIALPEVIDEEDAEHATLVVDEIVTSVRTTSR